MNWGAALGVHAKTGGCGIPVQRAYLNSPAREGPFTEGGYDGFVRHALGKHSLKKSYL
jgi:hypothetical protein